jgi:hypothetical protein
MTPPSNGRYLEGERSSLLKDVFVFLRELLKDHKQHLQDIFTRDRQLATEIEYASRSRRDHGLLTSLG